MMTCQFVSFSFATHGFFVDSHPDLRLLITDQKSRLKALGEKSRVPVHVPPSANTGAGIFVRLAKGYVVPDRLTKKEVCVLNTEVRHLQMKAHGK
jgi:hypothetical protein